MKLRLTIASVLALLLIGVGTAEAFQWHMRYGQAKNASKSFVKELCAEDSECDAWGVGQCYRQSESGFACQIGWFYADYPAAGEEVECDAVLHWGVSHSGYLALKRHGRPHCHSI